MKQGRFGILVIPLVFCLAMCGGCGVSAQLATQQGVNTIAGFASHAIQAMIDLVFEVIKGNVLSE